MRSIAAIVILPIPEGRWNSACLDQASARPHTGRAEGHGREPVGRPGQALAFGRRERVQWLIRPNRYHDRADAGRRLAPLVAPGADDSTLVVGLPRGGVVVAAEVARSLEVPLDVIIVQKIGHPHQPELAIGALGENGVRVLDADVLRSLGVTEQMLARSEATATDELARRVRRFRRGTPTETLAGRHVVIVDDGIATGASARAACRVARAAGADRITLAVPVAPPGWEVDFTTLADELICPLTPRSFGSVGRFYVDFRQTTDAEVLGRLHREPPAG
jgi:putative phosphoribosyl transferase